VKRLLLVLLILYGADIQSVQSMRIVVQRVKSASVTVDGQVVSSIGPGILALVGLHENDTEHDLLYCSRRLLACKLWENESSGGQWRHSVKQREYEVLLVSQFTLYGTLTKKFQPDYKRAMKAIPAQTLYQQFLDMVRKDYVAEKVQDGVFGAMMDVALVNDGPVTIMIESNPQSPSFSKDAENADSTTDKDT
jgi:D-aminoacyl-tRNA deacylase